MSYLLTRKKIIYTNQKQNVIKKTNSLGNKAKQLLLFFACCISLLTFNQLNAQIPCAIAFPLIHTNGCTSDQFAADSIYYSITASDSNMAVLVVNTSDTTNYSHIHRLKLFSGTCGSLVELATIDGDSALEINATNLIVGNTYYLCAYTHISPTCVKCQKPSTKYTVCVSITTTCTSPTSVCNLIQNPSFTFAGPNWWSAYGNGNPFYSVNGNVCSWDIYNGTPEIEGNPTNMLHSAIMWSMWSTNPSTPGSNGEGILQQVNIQSGDIYYMTYKAQLTHHSFNDGNKIDNYDVMFTQSANSGLPNLAAAQMLPGGFISPPIPVTNQIVDHQINLTSISWIQNSICFTANNYYDQFSIHPYMNNNPATNNQETWLGIDDITLLKVNDAGPDDTVTCLLPTYIGPSCVITGATYSWSPTTNLSNPNVPNPVASPTITTIYTLTVTLLNGCIGTDFMIVYHAPYPTPQIIDPGATGCDSMAIYSPINIDTSSTYTWQTTDNSFSPIPFTISTTGDTVTVNWAATTSGAGGYIILTEVDSNGCTGKDTVHIDLCCISATDSVIYNDTASVFFGANPGIQAFTNYSVNGTFVIDQDMVFVFCTFNMGPNAKIVVSGGSTVDFQTCTFRAGCCEMWDGIIGLSLTDTIIVEKNSYLGDAIRGITSNNGSVYIVREFVEFNRNYVSITVNPYAGNHGGIIQEATFRSVNTTYCPSSFGRLLPPYTNQWPLYGIYATSVDSITFGNPALATYTNLFTGLRYGIRTKNTNAKIYNNNFIAINKAHSSRAIWCAGRFPTIFPLNFTQYTVNVGGPSIVLAEKNQFLNCTFGVYTDTAMSTIVRNNTFRQTLPPLQTTLNGTAVRVNNCTGLFRVVDVINDSIINHIYGVYLNQNNNCTTRIWGNYIARNHIGNTGCTGVYQICNGNNLGTTSVYLNTIHSVQVGVRFANVKNATADNNFIRIRPTSVSSQAVRAIWAVNSTGVKITNNQIIKDNPSVTITSTWVGGIYVASSSGSRVTCNVINKIGYGIQFAGSGSTGATVFNNQLGNINRGIWLSNGAVIGAQGSPTVASDNSWTGTTITSRLYTSGTIAIGTDGNLSRFYYRPVGAIYNPNPTTSSGFPSSSIFVTPITNNPSVVLCAYVQPPSGGGGQNGQIAQGQIAFPGNQISGRWMSREGLYRQLLLDSTIAIGDTILTNFRDSADFSNVGKFTDAMRINSRRTLNTNAVISNAYTIIFGIIPNDSVESNYKTVESIMLGHQLNGGTFTIQELNDLRIIAQLCPFSDGNAVYVARGLLAPIDSTEYENSCEGEEENSNRYASPDVEQDSSFTFKLFPNPSNGEVSIEYQIEGAENGVLEIYTIAGRLITSVTLETGLHLKRVTLPQMDAGIYLYKISVHGEMKLTDRLVIIK